MTPPPVQRLVDELAGKGAGFQRAKTALERDPCATAAYKPVGPLRDRVCALHLARDYRLVFAFSEKEPDVLVLIAVGQHSDKAKAMPQALELAHEILGEEMPAGSADRVPCCDGDAPSVSEDEVGEAMERLRRIQRGR